MKQCFISLTHFLSILRSKLVASYPLNPINQVVCNVLWLTVWFNVFDRESSLHFGRSSEALVFITFPFYPLWGRGLERESEEEGETMKFESSAAQTVLP